MTLSLDIHQIIQQAIPEIKEVIDLYLKAKSHETAVTTKKGRTYKVANVVRGIDGSWIVSKEVSSGMYLCDKCNPPETNPGDDWTQFSNEKAVVRFHSSFLHCLEKHPSEINEESVKKISAVFLE